MPLDADPADAPSPAVERARRRVRDAFAQIEQRRKPPRPAGGPSRPAAPAPVSAGRPIGFNAAMVRAVLAGHKTQTRRPIRPLPAGETQVDGVAWPAGPTGHRLECRLATVGDLLWVREPWAFDAGDGRAARRVYEADVGPAHAARRQWKPGRFLARDASRLTLRVTGVRPERLGDIADADARAEGMPPGLFDDVPAIWFGRLWDSIYGGGEFAWDQNPWVWVITFAVERAVGRQD